MPSLPLKSLGNDSRPQARVARLASLGLLALLTLTSACDRRYIITTTGGSKIVTNGKPKLVQSNFLYRDAAGGTNVISKMRVRLIEPYSQESDDARRKIPELQ